jgi:hypothetical protein
LPFFGGYHERYIRRKSFLTQTLYLRSTGRVQIWMDGFTRIARGEPWAGSVTGGEASQNPCSEKEGFTHPPLWRAPCFWGTYEWELHAVDT